MTEPLGNFRTATRRAVTADYDARHRLGEVHQSGETFHAFDRLGRPLGSFPSADAAIECVRRHVAGGSR